jgi:hypothetical protein
MTPARVAASNAFGHDIARARVVVDGRASPREASVEGDDDDGDHGLVMRAAPTRGSSR